MLAVGLIALFSNVGQPTTGGPTPPTPQGRVLDVQGFFTEPRGVLGIRQIPMRVNAPLPQVPDRVPVYEVKVALDEPSPELARAWAEKLGLGPVRLYKEGDSRLAAYIARAEDGRTVRIGPDRQVTYQADTSAMLLISSRQQPAPDLKDAWAVAYDFLNRIPDLFILDGNALAKLTIRMEPTPVRGATWGSSSLTFQFTPQIDGIPVSSNGNGGQGFISIGSDGQVWTAFFTPLRITPTGKEVMLRPVETVVREFLGGDSSPLRGSSFGSISLPDKPPEQLVQPFYREPSYAVGEVVTARLN